MTTLRALASADLDAVHAAFLHAFSDYIVKLSPTREQLLEMLTRRGYVPEASVGVFEAEQLVAFTLNGVDGTTAYDSGTGTIPSHRRRGLGKEMLAFVEQRLRERGCTRYVLEVLEANTPAIQLYLNDGFTEVRPLQCWTYEAHQSAIVGDGELHPEWCDVEPSWQNSTASLRRANDHFAILGNDDGYAVVFPSTGDLPQLAVRKDARRRGIGRHLLDAAATLAGKPLRIMNVDARDAGIEAFLTSCRASKTVRQLELMKPLS